MSVENIINNPPKVFTEPCEACGVSEFQLGVKHAEERIIKLLENHRISLKDISTENWVGLWHDAVKKIKESTNE